RVIDTAPGSNGAIARLEAIDTALSGSERHHVVYDFGEVRGLDYYTGIHFEIFIAGAGTAVGAGGRYDDLMGRFGRPLPAVGLALDLDALAAAAPWPRGPSSRWRSPKGVSSSRPSLCCAPAARRRRSL